MTKSNNFPFPMQEDAQYAKKFSPVAPVEPFEPISSSESTVSVEETQTFVTESGQEITYTTPPEVRVSDSVDVSGSETNGFGSNGSYAEEGVSEIDAKFQEKKGASLPPYYKYWTVSYEFSYSEKKNFENLQTKSGKKRFLSGSPIALMREVLQAIKDVVPPANYVKNVTVRFDSADNENYYKSPKPRANKDAQEGSDGSDE